MFGGAIGQWTLALFEFNLELVATQNFFLFIQNGQLVNTLGQVNDGCVTSGDQSPFWPKVRIQNKDSITIGIWTHVQFINQWMIIWQWAFKCKILSCHFLDLMFLMFIGLVGGTVAGMHFLVILSIAPVLRVETAGAQRKRTGRSSYRIQT